MRLPLAAVLAAALLSFLASPANAQVFRRAAPPCPTCPNGVCGQPQPSGPLFLAVPSQAPLLMPGPATAPQACYATGNGVNCQCPAGCNCTSSGPTSTGRHYYVCPASLTPPQACPEAPTWAAAAASSCSTMACAAASAGSGRSGWLGLGVIGPGTGRGRFGRR